MTRRCRDGAKLYLVSSLREVGYVGRVGGSVGGRDFKSVVRFCVGKVRGSSGV